jgi:hypothetical protein
MNLEDLQSTARQFIRIKDELALLSGRQTELKKRLDSSLSEVDPDDRGHRSIIIEDAVLGDIKIIKQRKVSKSLDLVEAERILTEKGIRDTCIKMVPTIDEAAIMSAFYEGHLTEQDIDTMFPSKETFAFIVDNK